MNGNWIFEILLVVISVLISIPLGYYLGLRSQKIQTIREHVIDVSGDTYPKLFSEMKRNSETLDNYLENPNNNFGFPEISQIYDRGLDGFMKKHHKDLFLLVDAFHKKMLPKFWELDTLVRKLMDKLFDVSSNHLRKSLPKQVVDTSERIAHDLSKSINPCYIIPDLLNERDEEVRNKIERCILENTSHIYREKANKPYVIKGQSQSINSDEISKSLLEKAKPEIGNLMEKYRELKKQNDKEVKEKILPLLRKYISNPI